jgi:hypothetical protein
MSTFEITIERKTEEGRPVVVERTCPGSSLRLRTEGVLAFDGGTEPALLMAAVDPRAYGTVLGQALFHEQVRDAFVGARAETADDDRLRILLTVEDEGLRPLRWERLCAPFDGGWDLLALHQEVPFSLYLPSITDRRFPPIGRRDLRALIVAASPAGLDQYRLAPFDVAAAVAGVRAALGDIPSDVLASDATGTESDGSVGPATLDAIGQRITAGAYTLLHLVGHGSVARLEADKQETTLYLAKPDGSVDPVSGTRLLERFTRLNPRQGFPRFAFLAACESASPAAEAAGALGGLAQRLVRELGMPAVVAMTDVVTVTTATALAGQFYQRLRTHGQPDLALVEATAGLAERGDITVPALYCRLGEQSLFSDAVRPLLQLTPAEITDGLTRATSLLAERAPVLLASAEAADRPTRPGFSSLAERLRGAVGADHTQLSDAARTEYKQTLEEIDAVCTEALDLGFSALALGQEPPPYDARCPFRGLYPFRAEDREFYFGREALICDLLGKLADHPFLPVLGPSGSGKSSLVLAGLVPAWWAAAGKPPEEAPAPDMRPGHDPVAQLAATLARLADSPSVLVVDQFEEVFTLCRDERKRTTFFDRLLAVTTERPVVLTMRADFWGHCASYPALRAAMQAHQQLLPPMVAKELRGAMERQAAEVGLRFEAGVSLEILDDVGTEPGAMALLQHALLEVWNRRHGRWLTADEYRATGRVQQAIARTADSLYQGLPPDQRDQVRDIFVRLTQLGEDEPLGDVGRDTRRRAELRELVPERGDAAAVVALVARLADARLIVTTRNELTGREEVEVAHEALIRHWSRLREWLARDRADLRVRQELGQAARAWEGRGRDESSLVHWGSRLDEALPLATTFGLNELERAYLDACISRAAARERSSYLGQAAGVAVGAGLGYAGAFALKTLSMSSLKLGLDTTLLLALSFVPVGALVGFCIGIGLWLLRRDPVRRTVGAVLIGAIAGSAAYWLYREFVDITSASVSLVDVAAGGLLGSGIGLGVGFSQGRPPLVGLAATALSGLLGTVLFFRFVDPQWSPLGALLVGLLLGGLTGLGFQATAVRSPAQSTGIAIS